LETGRFTLSDVQRDLEAGVQDIEQTVGKSPHEEEDGDERDGHDGLASGDLGGTGDDLVADALSPDIESHCLVGRWPTGLLSVDVVQLRLLLTTESELENHDGGREMLRRLVFSKGGRPGSKLQDMMEEFPELVSDAESEAQDHRVI